MLPSADICRQAHVSRDPRFDGRFVVGVLTTGVFCRPVCPARTPREDNARYFASAAAALREGYRPCRRCRPEAAPSPPEWTFRCNAVLRALRLIDDNYLADHASTDLAAAVGVGARQLNRLFVAELGATPSALARTRRLLLARRLIDETGLAMTDVAASAGYGSLRRFNDEFRRAFAEPPSALRRRRSGSKAGTNAVPVSAASASEIELRMTLRLPCRAEWVLSFLKGRAISDIESVVGNAYVRRLSANACIAAALAGDGVRIRIPAAAIADTADILMRVRRLFDLDADSPAIDAALARQPELAPLVRAAPGIRVPGVWDALEGAVRAILGQQVSVGRATELAQRLCARFGDGAFPTAEALANADVAAIGMPGTRGRAVSEVAQRALADGDAWLKDARSLRAAFREIRGLGPWTAEYAAMRVARDPDAFPDSDWGVLKALGVTAAAARRWAAPCRPWRAYATMHLWRSRTRPNVEAPNANAN